MIPLALTSTAGWIRRLGGKRWQRLHRLVYVTAVCGVVHYLWLVKVGRQPADYLRRDPRGAARHPRVVRGHEAKPAADPSAQPSGRAGLQPRRAVNRPMLAGPEGPAYQTSGVRLKSDSSVRLCPGYGLTSNCSTIFADHVGHALVAGTRSDAGRRAEEQTRVRAERRRHVHARMLCSAASWVITAFSCAI